MEKRGKGRRKLSAKTLIYRVYGAYTPARVVTMPSHLLHQSSLNKLYRDTHSPSRKPSRKGKVSMESERVSDTCT